MAGGQAEPPMMVRFMLENCWPVGSTMAEQALPHGRHAGGERAPARLSNSSYSDLPSSAGPGKTSLAPTMHAMYGRPQALTWNIGTTGRIASRAEQFSASGSAAA